MSTMADHTTTTSSVELRILQEAYGQGAWHGPDLKAALADVGTDAAFRRPAPGRHNIAEIALHHAYCVRDVRAKLTGGAAEPFGVEDVDGWFELPGPSLLSWSSVFEVVAREQQALTDCVAAIRTGGVEAVLSEPERFDLILGITCHAVYHAGQIQLIKRLVAAG